MPRDSDPCHALLAWDLGGRTTSTPIPSGLINRTFLVESARGRFVLQQVNPIFAPTVHLDIEAITAHLEARGMRTPRLVRTRSHDLWCHDGYNGVWRLMTWLAGRTVHHVDSPSLAHAAGRLVATFHRAVASLPHAFHFTRPGAHDTAKHLRALTTALQDHPRHPERDRVAPLAERILRHAERLPALPRLPPRIAHGDLKISNILFHDDTDEALALLDLDTMSHLAMPVELGDAFRSWCNPAGENAATAHVDLATWDAAVRGYASGAAGLLSPEEVAALPAGTETIALELSARFCADALHESYFGWDPERFPSRSAHNQQRARSQLTLADDVEGKRDRMAELTARAFAGS
jgi:Ser/Thr protein kinase RdoA (MazF antagonist)